jgi:hypothetical protein
MWLRPCCKVRAGGPGDRWKYEPGHASSLITVTPSSAERTVPARVFLGAIASSTKMVNWIRIPVGEFVL